MGGGGRRPTLPKNPPSQAKNQTRPTSTAAVSPSATSPSAVAPAAGGGMLGQIASTAAGVAIGSTIGHALGGLFGGGSDAPAPAEAQNASLSQGSSASQSSNVMERCGPLMKEFTQCMDTHGTMSRCQWIFDQVKICQQSAESGY